MITRLRQALAGAHLPLFPSPPESPRLEHGQAEANNNEASSSPSQAGWQASQDIFNRIDVICNDERPLISTTRSWSPYSRHKPWLCTRYSDSTCSSAASLAEISVRSPQQLFIIHYLKNIFSGSKYPKIDLFNFENNALTCTYFVFKIQSTMYGTLWSFTHRFGKKNTTMFAVT